MLPTKAVRNRKGFTLVELSIVLVIIGIIMGAVLKGQDLIASSKAKRIQKDLQGFEAMIWTYVDRVGRFPGDCNSNGVINYNPPLLATGIGTATPPSNNADPLVDYCAAATTGEGNINRVFSDLRAANIASAGTPNINLAKHQMNDFFKVGATTAIGGIQYNMIVAYGIPAWMAKMIDVSIDGSAAGNTGRVRQYTTNAQGSAWPAAGTDDVLTAVVYYYDRTPPAGP